MPRISGESLEDHRDRTNARIFDAMAGLLGERGYDPITRADIAAAAGLARTAMYNYYPDKETLLVAYTAHETAAYRERPRAALDTVSTPLDQLRVFVGMQLNHLAIRYVLRGLGARVTADGSARRIAAR